MALPWRLSPRAGVDLDRILNFPEGHSTRAAQRIRARIADALQLISEHPRIGVRLRGSIRQTVTRLGRNAYIIRYRLTETDILITRIWHGKEDRPR